MARWIETMLDEFINLDALARIEFGNIDEDGNFTPTESDGDTAGCVSLSTTLDASGDYVLYGDELLHKVRAYLAAQGASTAAAEPFSRDELIGALRCLVPLPANASVVQVATRSAHIADLLLSYIADPALTASVSQAFGYSVDAVQS